jgi:DeoR family fructose operon transcriptional repressor
MRHGTVRSSNGADRRDELRRLVQHHGYVSSRQIAGELQVSDMTIRRDLDQLAEQGLVLRVVGGARRPTGAHFAVRATAAAAKEQIAATCAELFAGGLLEAGMVIALDAGTTVEHVARRLPAGITVVTHSVPVMAACAGRDDVRLIGLGGSYHAPTRSFGGPGTRAQLAEVHLDLAVVSASALQRRGLFCHDATEADTKRGMLAADSRLVVADTGKLTARAPIRIAGWEHVDRVVTDDALGEDERAALALWAPGVDVVTAHGAGSGRARDPSTGPPARSRRH